MENIKNGFSKWWSETRARYAKLDSNEKQQVIVGISALIVLIIFFA